MKSVFVFLLSMCALAAFSDSNHVLQVQLSPGTTIELLHVSAGSFTMGSPKSDPLRNDDEILHQVILTQDFWLGKFEITQQQWHELMNTTVEEQQLKQARKWPLRGTGKNLPMYLVSWNDCITFCQKLTKREQAKGRLPEGYAFTLPTEAQWEYACKSGLNHFTIESLPSLGWYRDTSRKKIHPTGLKKPNAWGFHDMHGNVSEWCLDWYGPYPASPITDPTGPDTGSRKVARGGSWFGPAANARPSKRITDPPEQGFTSMGFRIALSPIVE
jgi:formylglycine-generating enzyme required for sulfatase activity